MFVLTWENTSSRVRNAITTSSIDVLPARSPMPLIVHSTWRTPFSIAASEFATASPHSGVQRLLTTHHQLVLQVNIRSRNKDVNTRMLRFLHRFHGACHVKLFGARET